MQFGRNRALRESSTRAPRHAREQTSAEGDAVRFDNGAIIDELLALRQEEASLLGYPHFAAVSLGAPRWQSRPSR